MKANPPQPPFKKGGAYFRFLVGMFHRLLLKKSGAFSPPFLKVGGGDLLFTTTWATKNRPQHHIINPIRLSQNAHIRPHLTK
jgi:hypothetical protein